VIKKVMIWNKKTQKGMLLIDALIGIALLALSFSALFGVLQMSIAMIINTKSRIGAQALVSAELEYVRSLSYNAVGTVGGFPSGNIPQSQSISLNGISYVRHVLIDYIDDPGDGTGYNDPGKDSNGIVQDYKKATVSVTWNSRGINKTLSFSTVIIPKGIETACANCGTLELVIYNASNTPVVGADASITNYTVNPAIFETRTTGPSGIISTSLPSGSGYHIVVTKAGYSTDQTYNSSVANPNPSPGNLTVLNQAKTSGTFQIAELGSKTITTFHAPSSSSWSDTFVDDSKIAYESSVDFSSGDITLHDSGGGVFDDTGDVRSSWLNPMYLSQWNTLSWGDETSATTSVYYQVYYDDSGTATPIPDADLSGNSSGFSSSPVDISGLNIVTYPKIAVAAVLSTTDVNYTPSLNAWTISYTKHIPFADFPFNMKSTKTIGTDGTNKPIYKYDQDLQTDASGSLVVSPLEWGDYTIVPLNASYDISESCLPQPRHVYQGVNNEASIDLSTHTANSLLVFAKTAAGYPISNTLIYLHDTGFDEYKQGSVCGQAFFPGLNESSSYVLEVGAPSYATTTVSGVEVSGSSNSSVILAH